MESAAFPQNNSHQQLMGEDSDGVETITVPSISSGDGESSKGFRTVSCVQWITVAVLCYVNLINYMDRYTMAGKLIYLFWNNGLDIWKCSTGCDTVIS